MDGFYNDFDAFDDDLEVLEIVEHGIPRMEYNRENYFHSFSEMEFFCRFRLRKETVLDILVQIEDQLEYTTDRNRPISPINQLLTTLRYFASSSHLIAVGDFMGMHTATVSRIVQRVSRVIAGLYRRHIYFPMGDDIKTTQNAFFEVARFPRVVGAIDCTHIKIESPGGNDAEVFRNRKGYYSINVQAICNANLEFIDVVCRWPGSTHDSTIFNNSFKKMQFERNLYPNCLLLGDSGYSIHPYLVTPILNPQTAQEQLYNESHVRTRNVIERTFGVWKRRFPVLAYGCRLKLETVLNMVVACAVLHNIARKAGEEEPPLLADIEAHELQQLIELGQVPEVQQPNYPNNRGLGMEVRQQIVDMYFANL